MTTVQQTMYINKIAMRTNITNPILQVQRRRERAQPARRAQKNGLPDCLIWYFQENN